MPYYFRLQYKMLNRKIIEFGLPPLVGYVLMTIGFVGLSFFMFMKLESALYIYGLLAIGGVVSLGEAQRNDFLKNCFSERTYKKLRVIENLILTLPFSIFLFSKNELLVGVTLLFINGLLAVFQFRNEWHYALPTPFYKTPFEFLVGFRATIWAYLLICFLVVMSVSVGNFNLGLFALLAVFLVAMSYYSKPEETFFVWMYSLSATQFLFKKIQIAFVHSMILALPIAATLLVVNPMKWWLIMVILLIGTLYLVSMILAKYSAFPKEISVPEGVILMFGIGLPPLLLVVVPYFYKKAKRQIGLVLE